MVPSVTYGKCVLVYQTGKSQTFRVLPCRDALSEGDFAHVDLDQQRLRHGPVVAFVRVDPALCWHHDPVDVPVVRGVIEPRGTAQDVHRVVVPTKQAIRPKQEICTRVWLLT